MSDLSASRVALGDPVAGFSERFHSGRVDDRTPCDPLGQGINDPDLSERLFPHSLPLDARPVAAQDRLPFATLFGIWMRAHIQGDAVDAEPWIEFVGALDGRSRFFGPTRLLVRDPECYSCHSVSGNVPENLADDRNRFLVSSFESQHDAAIPGIAPAADQL